MELAGKMDASVKIVISRPNRVKLCDIRHRWCMCGYGRSTSPTDTEAFGDPAVRKPKGVYAVSESANWVVE